MPSTCNDAVHRRGRLGARTRSESAGISAKPPGFTRGGALMNLSIDQQIEAAHSEAERIESEARQIEVRIIAAGGALTLDL